MCFFFDVFIVQQPILRSRNSKKDLKNNAARAEKTFVFPFFSSRGWAGRNWRKIPEYRVAIVFSKRTRESESGEMI